ncbi:MAG: hypothetical protein PHW08_15605 [Kiritimatiellae bacterium]|nr:hypothetical protein [Kiritimatiellia bacterium]
MQIRTKSRICCLALAIAVLGSGCGHTKVSQVGLMSTGDLESRIIPRDVGGPMLEGKAAAKPGKLAYYLSDAVRDAVKGTPYDTLVDAEVTTTTGVWLWNNQLAVKGKGVKSADLPKEGGAQ